MAWTIYRSTDASAPTLNGTAGSLITVLDAVLVNGYGSQTGAGWGHPFSTSGNVAVYRPPSASTARMYYQINDNATFGATGREAAIVGYETMSDLVTGTNPFPTAAQATNGRQIGKSDEANGTAKKWVIAADNRTCVLGVYLSVAARWQFHYFGEIESFTPADAYHAIVVGGPVGTVPDGKTTNNISPLDHITKTNNTTGDWDIGGTRYLARSHDQLGTSIACQFSGATSLMVIPQAGNTQGWGLLPKTNPADGAVYMCDFQVCYPGAVVRGRLRGLWIMLHDTTNWANEENFVGTGVLAGRTFQAYRLYPAVTPDNPVLMALEISSTVT